MDFTLNLLLQLASLWLSEYQVSRIINCSHGGFIFLDTKVFLERVWCLPDLGRGWVSNFVFYTQITYLPTFLDHFSSSLKPSTISLPDLITLGSHNIPFSDSARNLGFILDSKKSTKKHVIKICQTAYFELKRISSIRRFLAEDTNKTCYLYILSWLDYCNCLLMGTPNSVIQPLQKIQNLLQDLFSWKICTGFPFQNTLSIKLLGNCMCFSAINGSGLAYLSELLHAYTPSRSLRSSSDLHMFEIQQYKCKTHGFHTFSCFGPHIWNSVPQDLDTAQSFHLLKPNWKPSSSHSISILTNISTQFLLQ